MTTRHAWCMCWKLLKIRSLLTRTRSWWCNLLFHLEMMRWPFVSSWTDEPAGCLTVGRLALVDWENCDQTKYELYAVHGWCHTHRLASMYYYLLIMDIWFFNRCHIQAPKRRQLTHLWISWYFNRCTRRLSILVLPNIITNACRRSNPPFTSMA